MQKNDFASFEVINFFQDTRLSAVIDALLFAAYHYLIDALSFAAYHSILGKISNNLKEFTQCQKHKYGKDAICFLGEFCQLEATGSNCIYKNGNDIFWEHILT
jgi:hypothetical protein